MPSSPRVASLLERYRDGDREAVWRELQARGENDGDDGAAVAGEAMARARSNVETIIERLRAQGYRFGDPFSDNGARVPHAPPDAETPRFVRWLADRFGPLPATVRAWIEIIGDVTLLGRHPAWPPHALTDPLVIEVEYKAWPHVMRDRAAARAFHESEYEAWEDCREEGERYVLCVAPDALHKANFSGGSPYGVQLPDASIDATFRGRDDALVPFIEYLRRVFRGGGFPSLSSVEHGARAAAAQAELADGLLDL